MIDFVHIVVQNFKIINPVCTTYRIFYYICIMTKKQLNILAVKTVNQLKAKGMSEDMATEQVVNTLKLCKGTGDWMTKMALETLVKVAH